MAQYEVRTWRDWHHMALVSLLMLKADAQSSVLNDTPNRNKVELGGHDLMREEEREETAFQIRHIRRS